MPKKYIVRLTEEERAVLKEMIRKLSGTNLKVRRAQILLKADADGPNWTDEKIAEAFDCWPRTVARLRRSVVEGGLEMALNHKREGAAAHNQLLDGEQEAAIIATRLGEPPSGYANWTLRLLAERVIELEIVDSISHETARKVLKKTDLPSD